MTAPKSDRETAPQHLFSKSSWSQYSETAVKVHFLCRCIKRLNLKNPIPGQPTKLIDVQIRMNLIIKHLDLY